MVAGAAGGAAEGVRGATQAAVFAAFSFAAASAVPFLSDAARARLSAIGFGAPPLLILAFATVLGAAALWQLGRLGYFRPLPGPTLRPAIRAAALLALPLILADAFFPLPAAINHPWPEAWLYYPMAAVPEAVLSLVPLVLLYPMIRRPVLAIPLAALAAPALALAWGPGGASLLVAAQAWGAGMVELMLLRRSGVTALIAFRLAHTLIWNILWGAARLWLGLAPA